jgi:hypothetical protein
MKYNKGFAPIVILIIIAIVGGGAYYVSKKHEDKKVNTEVNTSANTSSQYSNTNQLNTSTTVSVKASIDSFKVVKPYLYIFSHNLSKVEVSGVSTGTGVTDSHVLGSATLQSTDNAGVQTWVFKPGEILLTSMSVQGYASGSVVGTLNLPFSGASEIYETFN